MLQLLFLNPFMWFASIYFKLFHKGLISAFTFFENRFIKYGIDYHAPSKTNNNVINTEFQKFYQSILSNFSHVPDDQLAALKQEYGTLVTNTTRSVYLTDTDK